MKELIEQANESIAELQQAAAFLQNVILGEGFIVQCAGISLSFDIDSKRRVSNPCIAKPYSATRFTRADAARVAATVKNGNGDAGEAIHVRDAIEQALQGQRDLLTLAKAYQARQDETASFKVEAQA